MTTPYQDLKAEDPDDTVTDSEASSKPSRQWFRILINTTVFGGLAALSLLFFSTFFNELFSNPFNNSHKAPSKPIANCPSTRHAPPASPPAPTNPWSPLSAAEITSVSEYLTTTPTLHFNLTSSSSPDLALSDNFVYLIELYNPKKSDVLAYLASSANSSAPERYARVTIHHGSDKEPSIKDYLVGPISSEEPSINRLTEIYHRDDIPYNARGFASPREFIDLGKTFSTPELAEAIEDLFNTSLPGTSRTDSVMVNAIGPYSFDGTFRRQWISWRRNVPGPWLHPLNFFQYVDTSGTDPTQWKVLKVVYNYQTFPSIDSFLSAYKNDSLTRIPPRRDQRPDSFGWTTRKRTGVQRDLDNLPGPRSVSFSGLRFRVDKERQYISWMGWGMYLGFDRDMGLSLWDVRIKGERLIYQLAPQEAVAQYAGNDPMQSTTAWLDRYFGMGSSARDLLVGYDCPHEAVYLPATTYSPQGIYHRERAICVFEQDTGRPLTRHTGFLEGEFGAVKGYTLTVRSISTVGNYDYLFDYIFHLDGTIEVRLSASGYLQGGYWEEKQEPYGTAIRDTTMGSLHDHVINYKVDLDVAGTSNSLLRTTTSQEEVTQPWLDDDWGRTVIQQRITRKYIEDENDALLKFPVNFQGGYAIVNQNEKNRWGIPRGYAIHPGYSPVHNTVVGSKRLLNNANWARYNLAVSLRKETEPTSSSMWNMNLPGAPMVDFHRFFDGDNITQQDLVAWVNVGMHHLPQAEDAPNTRTNTATSSFFLTPLNYFDADISMESTNAILLTPSVQDDQKFGWLYDDYQVKQGSCLPEALAPFEYETPAFKRVDGAGETHMGRKALMATLEMYHRINLEL